MENKKSFVMYDNWATLISNLPTEQAGQLIQAMCAFQLGQEPQIEDQAVKAMFIMIRGKMEEDSRNYAEKCANAKASIQTRYQKKSEDLRTNTNVEDESTNVYERIRTKGDTDTDTDTDTETDTENDTETDKVLPSTTDLPEGNDIPGVKTQECNYQGVVDAFNETCVSLPRVKSLSEARKKAIKARLRQYSMDDLRTAFTKVEALPFLKGQNDRNWAATFDWVMKDTNLAKILDGNYDPRGHPQTQRASPGGKSYAEQHDEVTRWLYDKAGGDPAVFGR